MQVINQKNYFKYLDEIEKDISSYKRFFPKLKEFLKKDFPKTWEETVKNNFPNLYSKLKEKVETKYFSKNNIKTKKWISNTFPSKTFEESFFRASNNIKNIPKCLNCNGKTAFDLKNNEYHYFCCLKCKSKFESIIQIINGKKYSFKEYSIAVRKLTEERCHNIQNINLRGNKFHLDHKVSIYQSFKDLLDIDVAASIHNLEIINAGANLAKGIQCSLSSNELIKLHLSSIK